MLNQNEQTVNVTKQIEEAAQFIEQKQKQAPEIGLILGSGLGVLADLIEDAVTIPYEDIPHFPVSTVEGHAGEWVSGTVNGRSVVMMKGRFHLYEGYPVQTVTFPIRVMKKLGVKTLIVTNAAGGINESFSPGDLMVISDHINFMSRNPLIGKNEESLGPRFPDMSQAYSKALRDHVFRIAENENIELKQGVYVGVLGPSYETPAEIRMLRTLGADAVGMSTVPEVIAARHSGIDVIGISCISNMAAGILDQPLSHEEVIETTEKAKEKFLRLVMAIVGEI